MKRFVITYSLALMSFSAFSQVSIDKSASYNEVGLTSTWSSNFDVGNHENRVLLVGVAYESGSSLDQIQSVTFDGSNMTKVVDGHVVSGYVNDVEIWFLPAPRIGVHPLQINAVGGGAHDLHIVVLSVFNADQDMPRQSGSNSSISTAAAIGVSLGQVTANSLIFDMVVTGHEGASYAEQQSQVIILDEYSPSSNSQTTKAGYRLISTSQGVSSSYLPNKSANRQAIVACTISPAIWTKNNDEAIYTANKVAIGTATSDATLTVKGDIHAEEVIVDLTVPGPDYVFEQDYNLLSLQETEEYIKAHKHLPEIPTAKEMEEQGIDVATMNMLLLKKVEELTLLLIEQNKDITELKKGLESLKN